MWHRHTIHLPPIALDTKIEATAARIAVAAVAVVAPLVVAAAADAVVAGQAVVVPAEDAEAIGATVANCPNRNTPLTARSTIPRPNPPRPRTAMFPSSFPANLSQNIKRLLPPRRSRHLNPLLRSLRPAFLPSPPANRFLLRLRQIPLNRNIPPHRSMLLSLRRPPDSSSFPVNPLRSGRPASLAPKNVSRDMSKNISKIVPNPQPPLPSSTSTASTPSRPNMLPTNLSPRATRAKPKSLISKARPNPRPRRNTKTLRLRFLVQS